MFNVHTQRKTANLRYLTSSTKEPPLTKEQFQLNNVLRAVKVNTVPFRPFNRKMERMERSLPLHDVYLTCVPLHAAALKRL